MCVCLGREGGERESASLKARKSEKLCECLRRGGGEGEREEARTGPRPSQYVVNNLMILLSEYRRVCPKGKIAEHLMFELESQSRKPSMIEDSCLLYQTY